MKKYIDADKLIAEIERLKQDNETSDDKEYAQYEIDVACGYAMACEEILSIIASLQQEQPKVEFEEEIDVFFYGKNFKRCNDGVRVPGALMRDWQNQNVSRSLSTDEIRRFAHHFWNKGYNARKEETK